MYFIYVFLCCFTCRLTDPQISRQPHSGAD